MPSRHDGPASPRFEPLPFDEGTSFKKLAELDISAGMRAALGRAPSGSCTGWGIPFVVRKPLVARTHSEQVALGRVRAEWLVFLHTLDSEALEPNAHGFYSPMRGAGRLAEHVADYVLLYEDGTEARHAIRRRHQVGALQRPWGDNCFEAVPMRKPQPLAALHEQASWPPDARGGHWGPSQTRAQNRDQGWWTNWLWAWANPHPRKWLVGLRVEPVAGTLVLSGLAGGRARSTPIRWETRRKALLQLPKGERFEPALDDQGRLKQIQLDLGQVISAQPRFVYPEAGWSRSYDQQLPEIARDELVVEFTAHPDATFHLSGGRTLPVSRLARDRRRAGLKLLEPGMQRVRLRVVEKGSTRPVPVRLHVHGEAGEYLAPVDRHRIPNPAWFEDYSSDHVTSDFTTGRSHYSTYIPGETTLDLPLGNVYLEVSKGFEVKPVRKVVAISRSTRTLKVTLDRVLPWRERG
jgi:hypothetical protein